MTKEYYIKINGEMVLIREEEIDLTKNEEEKDNFMNDIFDSVNQYSQLKGEILLHASEGNFDGAHFVIESYQDRLKNDDNNLDNKNSYIVRNTISLFIDLLKDTDINSHEHYLVSEIFATNDYIATEHITLSYWLIGSFEQATTLLELYKCHLKENNYDDFFSTFSKYLQRKDYFEPNKDMFFVFGDKLIEHDKKMKEVFLELVAAYNLSHNITDQVEQLDFNPKTTKKKI